jgi:outer membrane biosynthesis protein TonB
MRALVCLIALFATLAAAPSAFAQAEDRGYGGPATVGPNFSTGKQSAPPDYGTGAQKKKPAYKKPSAAKKQTPPKSKSAAKPAKQKPAAKTVQKPSKPKTVAKTKPNNDEPSTKSDDAKQDTAATTDGSATTAAKPETCRRFDATTSTTIEVPCS